MVKFENKCKLKLIKTRELSGVVASSMRI
jgi:hypothetical protein